VQRNVMVLTLTLAMLAMAGFANAATTPTTTAAPGPAAGSAPPSAARAAPAAGTGPVIRWEAFYDRNGNALPCAPPDIVGADSLYFKRNNVTNVLYGSPKAEVPDPAPASCRTGFGFLTGSTRVGMDPLGDYIYEVNNTTLRRHSTSDGSHTDYTVSNGGTCCMTDGVYLYVPVGNVVYKYSLIGTLVSSTTINITPLEWAFSVANDTVWCGSNSTTLNGYACSKFNGGSITEDAVWNLGTGAGSGVIVCWDGSYYYAAWSGFNTDTFKLFGADRTILASGTINIDPRSVMCAAKYQREVAPDSLYWKLVTSTGSMYSSPKAQDVTPSRPTAFAWQYHQAVSCMTPDGRYLFEVYLRNLRRTDLLTGEAENYTLADSSGGACATDGEYVYVPLGTTTRKYTLDGTLVGATTTDYAPWAGASTFGFGVANDTVWLTPAEGGTTWYGYACSKFTGGSITHDATWSTVGGSYGAATVAFDGRYYYMVWGGFGNNTFLRFNRDRTLYSSGTVTGDPRSVMCKAPCPLMIVSTGEEALRGELAETLKVASGGAIRRVGTYSVRAYSTFPATDWYNAGCRVILEFSGSPYPIDPAAVGDSLARFLDWGGRVVTAMWADNGTLNLGGRYVAQFMPFTQQPQPNVGGTMSLVHDPLHPIMDGVTTLAAAHFITGNTHSTLRSPNCVCLAEWDSDNRSVAAYLDSAGVRLASVGFVPFPANSGATGQWAKLLVNAILWVWPGMPAVSVTAPDTGDVWSVGSSHDITWTAANGPIVKDSIVYSNDNGAAWNFVDKHSGSRTSYTWTIPNSTSMDCYVRVFTWNAVGQGYGTSGKFQIQAAGVEQPENNVLPLAFALRRTYPNPLASGATVLYDLPRPASVELHVYDVTGALVRRLVEGEQPAGYQRAYWNGCDERGRSVAPRVYYCRLKADNFTATEKLIVRR
jgi:hypothetical protein